MCFKACLECFSTPRFNHALRFGQIVLNGWATLIAEINDYALDESWVFPVSSQPTILMSTTKLQGVTPTMHNGFYYDAAWLTA